MVLIRILRQLRLGILLSLYGLKSRMFVAYLRSRFPWTSVDQRFLSLGAFPYVYCDVSSKLRIGHHVTIVNSTKFNPIGIFKRSSLVVRRGGTLRIGNYVGMSGVSIGCYKEIFIGDNVLIGANVLIFDSDFHSLDQTERIMETMHRMAAGGLAKPVHIGDSVFIGANSLICKGVTIGEGSVVAAGAVVVCDIPPREVWGGNPARRIRG